MRLLPLAVVFAALLAACPELPDPPPDAGPVVPAKKCVGGVITADGGCEAKCDPSKCLANNTCVGNRCRLECARHDQCKPYVQQCLPAKEDDTGAALYACMDTTPLEYGDPCPNGTECESACANWDGPADVDAYCAPFCANDTDCPAGYECLYDRSPLPLCEDAGVGNDGFCGQTSDPCVSVDTIAAPDSGYGLTPFCIQRGVCQRRDVCSPCVTDLDCSYNPELTCLQINDTEKACVTRCLMTSDCPAGNTCAGGYCLPFGDKCQGDRGFCAPCKSDLDCDAPHACYALHGTERSCIDVTYSKVCATDNDCPLSAAGKRGSCVDISQTNTPRLRCGPPYDGDVYSCY